MKKRLLSTLIVISMLPLIVSAQLTENFNDGDFTNNPTWTGGTSDFIVNAASQLQSNNTVASSSFYLSTANTLATVVQWDMFIKLDFGTSSLNYVDVFLISANSDLGNASNSGYFVRLGNTKDEICLYRRDAGTDVLLIDGIDGAILSSNNNINLRVTRNAANQWSLYRDMSGTGTNYFLEGITSDGTYTSSSFFGIYIKQSTASFFQKHYFDDISVQPYVPDVTPPVIQSVSLVSGTAIDVLFDEPIDATSAAVTTNYSADNGIGNPVSATRDAANLRLVHLIFGATFPNGPLNTLTVNGVTDLSGNAIVNGTGTFTYVADVTPPAIVSATVISGTELDVLFNEPLDPPTAQNAANYFGNNGIGSPVAAVLDAGNNALVHLTFGAAFPGNIVHTLTVNNVTDLSGNAIVNGTASFTYTPPYIAQRFDVVIDEIFPDPTPVVALPDAEYVEIRNRSTMGIPLQGWKISSSSTTSGAFPAYTLPPGGYLILTGTSNVAALSSYGPVLGITSFPALLNDGTTLSLISKEGLAVHAVSYNTGWYKNVVKSDGGWSLEMIDIQNPCTGADNWKASEDARGGTPGTINSVNGNNPDQVAPALLRAAAADSVTLILTFSEAIDSTSGATTANYTFSNGAITAASIIAPGFTTVYLTLANPMVAQTVYTVTANNVKDCSGNSINAQRSARVGLPGMMDSLDVVINEILFNPRSNGYDYVEVYNRSNNIFDLKNFYLASRDIVSGTIKTLSQVSAESRLLFPGEFMVLSENAIGVKQNYVAKNPDNFIDMTMPSFSDDEGIAVLLNGQGRVIDELHYDAQWHFALIDNEEGVSLERIDYSKPTQDKSNWFSAASTVGYGTPSYQNSQFKMNVTVNGNITITPKIFSPDNDGYDDFAVINYTLDETGYVGNITIFDASGRPVKVLAKNATLAQTGSFRWDGLNDKFAKVPTGTYVVYTEVFNLNNKKKAFKNTITVASRF